MAQHDQVLGAAGHHGRDGPERVERLLVPGDRGALQLREPAQRVAPPGAAQSGEQRVELRFTRVLARRHRQRLQHRVERRRVLALVLREAELAHREREVAESARRVAEQQRTATTAARAEGLSSAALEEERLKLEDELELRRARLEAEIELRWDDIDRREEEVEERERRVTRKEQELVAYVSQVQDELARRERRWSEQQAASLA